MGLRFRHATFQPARVGAASSLRRAAGSGAEYPIASRPAAAPASRDHEPPGVGHQAAAPLRGTDSSRSCR